MHLMIHIHLSQQNHDQLSDYQLSLVLSSPLSLVCVSVPLLAGSSVALGWLLVLSAPLAVVDDDSDVAADCLASVEVFPFSPLSLLSVLSLTVSFTVTLSSLLSVLPFDFSSLLSLLLLSLLPCCRVFLNSELSRPVTVPPAALCSSFCFCVKGCYTS